MGAGKVAPWLDRTFKDDDIEEISSDTYSFYLLVGDSDHPGPHMMWGCVASTQKKMEKQIKVINNNFRLYWCFLGNVRRDPFHNTSLFTIYFLCVSHC